MQSVILVSADELPWLVRFRYDEKMKCWNPPYNQFIMSGLGIRFPSPALFFYPEVMYTIIIIIVYKVIFID